MNAGTEPACRVLIIEDEMLIALMLQDMVTEVGLTVEAIANSLHAGLNLARTADVQLAILDINLNGEESYPIAEVLQARRVPLIFSTGYGAGSVRAEYDAVPKLVKPYQQDLLEAAIRVALAHPLA